MLERRFNNQGGFTLLEIIIAMGVMAVLAGVVIVAINPSRQTAAARNIQRQSDLEKIQGALNQYAIAGNGSFPAGLSANIQMIGTATSGCAISCGPDTIPQIISSFLDNDQSDFVAGIFNDTWWNLGSSSVTLDPTGLANKTGNYISGTKDAGAEQVWNSFSWTPGAPYTKELPNNQQSEGGYPSGNANMTGNRLLMHLNESSGAITDSSGNGNNGTVNGSIVYGSTGKLNNGLSWSGGTNRYVQVPNNATLNLANTGGSVSVWVQPTLALAANTGMGVIRKPDYGASLTTPGGYGIELYRTSAGGPHNVKVHLGWNNGTANSQQTLVGTTNLVSGTWYHLVFTWNAATMTIYVNGALDATAPRVNGQLNWASNTAALDIGRNTDSVSTNRAWYNGVMDEIALFNRTLSPAEALDFYKRGALRLRAQVRTCDEAECNGETYKGPAGTSSDYYSELMNTTLGMPNLPITSQIPGRWFEYQMFFDTDTSYSPELRTVSASNNGVVPLNPTTEMTAASCLNLNALTPADILSIPYDPLIGSQEKTYYAIKKINTSNIIIRACSPELDKSIEIKQ